MSDRRVWLSSTRSTSASARSAKSRVTVSFASTRRPATESLRARIASTASALLAVEAADDCVGMAVYRAPHDRRGLGEPVFHGVSLDLDGFGRFGEPGRDSLAVAPQRRNDMGAARVEPDRQPFRPPANGFLRAIGCIRQFRGDSFAARTKGVEGLIVARTDAPDDVIGVSGERARHGERRLDHLRGKFALTLPNGPDRARRARSNPVDDLVRSGAEGAGHRFRRAGELSGDRRALAADRLDCVRAARHDAVDDFVAMSADRVRQRRRRLEEARGYARRACPAIASTASALLAVIRDTISSACVAAASLRVAVVSA